MIENVLILDDVYTSIEKDKVEEIFLGPHLQWQFLRDVAFSDGSFGTPGLGKTIVEISTKYIDPILKDVIHIPMKACDRVGLKLTHMIKARSFMHFPLREELRKEHDRIHTDWHNPHTVCLYYVNDTDGDTFIFEKISESEFNVIQRIKPQKGRVVLFNGNRYHASSGPTLDMRCIINFDLVTEFIPQ